MARRVNGLHFPRAMIAGLHLSPIYYHPEDHMSTEQFDLEEIYDEQIAPLMTQIIAICAKHNLPIAATFEYATDAFCTTTMGFDRASERMQGIIEKMKPRQHHTLAVTEATTQDGHKTITVSRIA